MTVTPSFILRERERERVQHKKGKITLCCCIFFCILSFAQFMIRPHNPYEICSHFLVSARGVVSESQIGRHQTSSALPSNRSSPIRPILPKTSHHYWIGPIFQPSCTTKIPTMDQYYDPTSRHWTDNAEKPLTLNKYFILALGTTLCTGGILICWHSAFCKIWKYSGCGSGAPWEAKWRGVKLYLAFQYTGSSVKLYLAFQYTRSSVKLYLAFQYTRSSIKLYLALHLCTSFICSTQINRTQEYRESWRMPGGLVRAVGRGLGGGCQSFFWHFPPLGRIHRTYLPSNARKYWMVIGFRLFILHTWSVSTMLKLTNTALLLFLGLQRNTLQLCVWTAILIILNTFQTERTNHTFWWALYIFMDVVHFDGQNGNLGGKCTFMWDKNV